MPALCAHHVLYPDSRLAFTHHRHALPTYDHEVGRRTRGRIQCSSSPASIDSETSSILVNDMRRCECYDLYNQHVPYKVAWRWQRSMVESRATCVQKGGQDPNDSLMILQHLPVYTLGTRSSEDYILFDKHHPPCEVYRTERGGEVTYHGPGQLVMYPLLNLRHHKTDLHWYLRSLEEVVIRALWSACDIEASRVEGLTGVWVGNKKVAAIGVRVSRWITYHGLALNVTTDLSPFKSIVPCGIDDRPVGSVLGLLESRKNQTNGINLDDQGFLLDLLHKKLLLEFSSVFGIDLIRMSSDIEW